MPRLLTMEMKGKPLYFDLRKDGIGKAEGFWAQPIFLSDEHRIERECSKKGQSENAWKEKLVFALDTDRDWDEFCDFHGNPIPCTPENVRGLCESDPAQMRSMLILIHNAASQGREDTEKN